jgi:hypothetical protein
MKTKIIFQVWMMLGLFVAPLGAAETPTAPARTAAELKELATVEQFLDLSDADLEQVQQVIARLRAMKPAEREVLRAEIAKFRALPAPQRQQLRQGWGWMPPEIQNGWREMMQGATNERRTEIQTKMQSMPPEERMIYRRQLVEEFLKAKAAKK